MPPENSLLEFLEKFENNNFAKSTFGCKRIKTLENTTNLKCHLDAMYKKVLPKAKSRK